MTQEDEPDEGTDPGFTIDTTGDSRSTRARRPGKRTSYLPVFLLALAAFASVVAFGLVLNRQPPEREQAKTEDVREVASASSPKKDGRKSKSAREKRASGTAVSKNGRDGRVVAEEEGTRPVGANSDFSGSIQGGDLEPATGADMDKKGLGDASDTAGEKSSAMDAKSVSEIADKGKAVDDSGNTQADDKQKDTRPSVDEAVLALHESGRLLVPKSYKALRAIHARDFGEKHASKLALAFGADHEMMGRWLDENVDLKEELLLALDANYDDIVSALSLFRDLKKQFPGRFPAYGELAIATAVVWDKGGRGVYSFDGHQRRTKAKPPENTVGAVENFKYLLDAEKAMGGSVRFLPWEFMVHVVNHRTAIGERKWALGNYLQKRTGFGKCYHDVPYDYGMLAGEAPKLSGQYYSLENIRRYGGVCSMQADFAGRVGKSLGVPAEYVSGESRGGERHAWVMWVELQGVSKGKIAFELKSHGRYRGDRYYVGHLTDAHTGESITDRELELRLHTVGLNPQNKRHAALVMKSFPMLRDATEMSVVKQIHFLHKVMQLSPGNEQAWLALAAMSRDGKIDKSHSRKMTPLLDQLFVTFANFPDFTWIVFDDLIAFVDSQKQKNLLYERLVNLYVRAKRPDLACRAVLKYADYLAAEGKGRQAIIALGTTIMAFPDEGRFVPKMLDSIEGLCPEVAGANKQLAAFYQALLPKIPQRRGKTPQPYCIKMYKRGIGFFEKSGQPGLALPWRARLAKLEAEIQ